MNKWHKNIREADLSLLQREKYILLMVVLLFIASCNGNQHNVGNNNYSVEDALQLPDTVQFERVLNPRSFHFPEDLGPHYSFETEWWYYTGNLSTREGRHFGYELTIFRSGLLPGLVSASDSSWRSRHIYMAHLAFTDVESGRFYSYERFSRPANALAGARASPFKVWLEDWKVEGSRNDKSRRQIPDMNLKAKGEEVGIDLTLVPKKSPVAHGNNGLDQKGPDRGNASYYFSLTRLETEGTVSVHGKRFRVTGVSWMDREWSTSALAEKQVGWDWFALQLDNQIEIMYYRLRNRDGSVSAFSNGTMVYANGSSNAIGPEEIQIKELEYWRSPSNTRYPVRWRINIAEQDISLEIIPYIKNQELQTRFQYWEGAVKIRGNYRGQTVSGEGYVELTGYGDNSLNF